MARDNYAALRIATAKIVRYETMKDNIERHLREEARKPHFTVHTDFSKLRDTSETREERIRRFKIDINKNDWINRLLFHDSIEPESTVAKENSFLKGLKVKEKQGKKSSPKRGILKRNGCN